MDEFKVYIKKSYIFYLIASFFKFLRIRSIFGKPIVFINFFKIFHKDSSFLYFNPGSIEANEFFFDGINGSRESTSLLLFSHLSRSSKYILDIGSYHGLFSFLAATSNPNALIKAFEPVKSNAKIFKSLIQKNQNKNIQVFEFALSNYSGTTYISNEVEHPSGLSLEDSSQDLNAEKIFVVNTKNLFTEKIQHPIDLVKIDVERHECIIVKEMLNWIDASRTSMIIEILNKENLVEVMMMLEPKNFLVYGINEKSTTLLPIKDANFAGFEYTQSGKFFHTESQVKIYNFLFIPIEKKYLIETF